MHLLDFSFPKTEEEEALEKAALEAEKEPEVVREYGEPDEVKPITEPEISIDDFFKIEPESMQSTQMPGDQKGTQQLQADAFRRYKGKSHRIQHQERIQAGRADRQKDHRSGKPCPCKDDRRYQRRYAPGRNEQCMRMPGDIRGRYSS